MHKDFTAAIIKHQAEFDLELSEDVIARLANYYELVLEHNPLLHLVGPCSPEEFAIRHILESLTLLEYLPRGANFADVGAGAGLPSIPCLLARDDLKATLIESKEKKSKFLATAAIALGITDRARIVNAQFSEVQPGQYQFITCRALDKFTENLPRLIKWSGGRKLLFFSEPDLRKHLETAGLSVRERLIPLSERRFLFVAVRAN